jgi:type IV pilus assembly protein PilW
MSSRPRSPSLPQRGYSLVELLVALVIALFLIGGVIIIEQSVHTSYDDRSGLQQLDDEERFTMTLLTEVVQSAGYYPDPATNSVVTAFPIQNSTVPNGAGDTLTFATTGQTLYGLHKTQSANGQTYSLDTLAVRYMTASGDGIPLCDGTSNTSGGNVLYTNYFYIQTAPDPDPSKPPDSFLYCALEAGNAWSATTPVQLVENVEYMQIDYGLHVPTGAISTPGDYAVNVYVPAADMTTTDWPEVTAVRITVTFVNPLKNQAGQPQTVTFTKVIDIMGRAGGN